MIVEIKITTWERWHLNGEQLPSKEKVIEEVSISPDNLFGLVEHIEIEKLADCDEFMLPEENDGLETVAIYDDMHQVLRGTSIWSNAINQISE